MSRAPARFFGPFGCAPIGGGGCGRARRSGPCGVGSWRGKGSRPPVGEALTARSVIVGDHGVASMIAGSTTRAG